MITTTEFDVQAMSIPNDEEAILLKQAQAGDMIAWETLVRHYQTAVFRLAYLILQNQEEAEDAAQDAFVRAYDRLEQVDVSQGLRPWLLRLTRNVALNQQRSLTRYWHMTRRYFQLAPMAENAHQNKQIANLDEAEMLAQAIQQLRPNGRDIIYLRYFLGLSEAEAASTLNIPLGTAKSRLSRALKKLHTLIEKDYPALRSSLYDH